MSKLRLMTRRRVVTTGISIAAVIGLGAVVAASAGASIRPASVSSTASSDPSRASGVLAKVRAHLSTVTAVGDSTLSVAAKDGTATTYTISPTTIINAAPALPMTLSTIQVGDRVFVLPTAKGATTAAAVHVLLRHVVGEITAVDATSVTVKGRNGAVKTITYSGTTVIKSAGAVASSSALVVGKYVLALGRFDSAGTTLDAMLIHVGDKAAIKKAVKDGLKDRIKHWRAQHPAALA